MPNRKVHRRMSHVEAIKVNAALSRVCTSDDDGFAHYAPGESDETVLARLHADGVDVAPSSVTGLRRQLFGNFPPAESAPDVVEMDEAALAALNERLIAIPQLSEDVERLTLLAAQFGARLDKIEAWIVNLEGRAA